MTKAYEKDKRFLETEKEQCIGFHPISPWQPLLVMSKQLIEKLKKYKTSGKHCQKRYNLRYQLVKTPLYHILDIVIKKTTKDLLYFKRKCASL